MDFSTIKNRLTDHKAYAEKQIQYIKAHPHMDVEKLHGYIYDYVLYKYNLFGEVSEIYTLDELAKLSVAKALKLSREKAVAFDNKASCDGATSAMNKKVLLMMAIQRELCISFPLDKTAGIKNTKDLARVIWDILNGQ